jgi:hypothetical protein
MNFNNFKIIKAIRLILLHRRPLEWHYLHTKFHEKPQSGSEVIIGGPKDRQTGDFISLISIFESRLQMY